MAAANPAHAFNKPPHRAVLLHCPNHIMAARWLKSALPPDERTQCALINSHQENQHSSRQLRHRSKVTSHREGIWPERRIQSRFTLLLHDNSDRNGIVADANPIHILT
jgi:hypothetical protein